LFGSRFDEGVSPRVCLGRKSGVEAAGWSLPLAAKLLIAFALSGLAVACRGWLGIAGLLLGNLGLLVLSRADWAILLQAGRLLIGQSLILVSLYVIRFGWAQGIAAGAQLSCQLLLAFLPGMIALQTIPRSQLTSLLARLLPSQGAFVLATTLHFFPLLLREMKTLYASQVLRGCRIMPRDLFKPWCWQDFVQALLVPAVVLALALAGDIALAAKAREFTPQRQRTIWLSEDRQ